MKYDNYWKCFIVIISLKLLVLPVVPAPTDKSLQINTLVTGLNPYTMYKFRAIGVNVLGEGLPSQPSCKFIGLLLVYTV